MGPDDTRRTAVVRYLTSRLGRDTPAAVARWLLDQGSDAFALGPAPTLLMVHQTRRTLERLHQRPLLPAPHPVRPRRRPPARRA